VFQILCSFYEVKVQSFVNVFHPLHACVMLLTDLSLFFYFDAVATSELPVFVAGGL
jgi:hypothetical protein